MALYTFTGPDVTSGVTNQNYLAGDKVSTASYMRVLQGLAVVVLQNTPAIADWAWRLYAGPNLLAQGTSIVGQTTGAEVRAPDDYTGINIQIPAGQQLTVEVTDTDAATHNARIYFLFDRL